MLPSGLSVYSMKLAQARGAERHPPKVHFFDSVTTASGDGPLDRDPSFHIWHVGKRTGCKLLRRGWLVHCVSTIYGANEVEEGAEPGAKDLRL